MLKLTLFSSFLDTPDDVPSVLHKPISLWKKSRWHGNYYKMLQSGAASQDNAERLKSKLKPFTDEEKVLTFY